MQLAAGKTVTLNVNLDDKVDDVRKRLLALANPSQKDASLVLLWTGEQLQDGHTLRDYNISPNSELTAHERLKPN